MSVLSSIRVQAAACLRQGITPRRLALTLALGFALGCIPVVGLPTALCAVVALAFRLNQPAIQAANYAAMPLQVALIWPFARFGARLLSWVADSGLGFGLTAPSSPQWYTASSHLALRMGSLAGQALLAWLLVAVPMVVLLTPTLTLLLRRVPALASRSAD